MTFAPPRNVTTPRSTSSPISTTAPLSRIVFSEVTRPVKATRPPSMVSVPEEAISLASVCPFAFRIVSGPFSTTTRAAPSVPSPDTTSAPPADVTAISPR